MAIAFDASSIKEQSTGTANLTNAHTCSGADRILFVLIDSQSDNVTSVTYNSVAMTQAVKVASSSANEAYIYYLVAPDTGSHDVAVNRSGSNFCGWVAHSYTGASQTGQPDAVASEAASTSPNSIVVTTVVDDCWAVCLAGFQRDWALTAGGLERTQTSGGQPSIADSNAAISTAGAHTFTWTTGSPADDVFLAVSFAPATDQVRRLLLLGIGT